MEIESGGQSPRTCFVGFSFKRKAEIRTSLPNVGLKGLEANTRMGACRKILRETSQYGYRVDPGGASERGTKFPTRQWEPSFCCSPSHVQRTIHFGVEVSSVVVSLHPLLACPGCIKPSMYLVAPGYGLVPIGQGGIRGFRWLEHSFVFSISKATLYECSCNCS